MKIARVLLDQVPSQRPILFGDYPQQFVANQEASAVLWGQMLAQAPQQQQQVVKVGWGSAE